MDTHRHGIASLFAKEQHHHTRRNKTSMNSNIEAHRRNYAIYKRRKAVKKAAFAAIWFVFGIIIGALLQGVLE